MNFSNDTERKVFEKLAEKLPSIIKDKCDGYDELYGYKLNSNDNDAESMQYYDEKVAYSLLYKFCKAYSFEYETIVLHIISILKWRKEFNPLSCAFREVHHQDLQTVGILTSYPSEEPNKRVVTWNLYGKLAKRKDLFQDVEKFLRYRVGLMERGLRLLDFTDKDNCYMTQVHDYKGVSMFKMDSEIKKCTKQTIQIFQNYYPELLYAKYFVNVPSVFSWVYDVVKQFIDPQTRKKFVVLNEGTKLGKYLSCGPRTLYGGTKSPKNETLQDQNVTDTRPTEYGLYILNKQTTTEVD